jgi:hypothetical protein
MTGLPNILERVDQCVKLQQALLVTTWSEGKGEGCEGGGGENVFNLLNTHLTSDKPHVVQRAATVPSIMHTGLLLRYAWCRLAHR